MKYCNYCRLQLQDNLQACPRCGFAQAPIRQPQQGAPIQSQQYRGQQPVSQQPVQRAASFSQPMSYPPSQYPPQQNTARAPSSTTRPMRTTGAFCGRCGAALRFISDYSSYYCDRCKEYRTPPVTEPAKPDRGVSAEHPPIGSDRIEPVGIDAVDIKGLMNEPDERVLGKKISLALSQIKGIIEQKEKDGFDVSELSELYRSCGNVFASEDVLTAVHYLERIRDHLEKVPDRPKDIGPEPKPGPGSTTRTARAAYSGTGDGTDQELEHEESDQAVDIDESNVIDDWDFDDKPEMNEREKAVNALESAKTAIVQADENGFDTVTAKKLFQAARPLYESKNYRAVIDKAYEVEREILRSKGHSEHEIREILGEAIEEEREADAGIGAEGSEEAMTNAAIRMLNDMITKTWGNIKEAEKVGLDVSEYKKALDKARTKHPFKSARMEIEQLGRTVRTDLEDYRNRQHDKASNMFHHVRSEIDGAVRLGLDVTPYLELLDSASTSISSSNYPHAISTMDKCLNELKKAVEAKTMSVQTQAAATAGAGKPEPALVWEPEPDDMEQPDEARSASVRADISVDKIGLTDGARLKILEDRFILGEISEKIYRELKEEILKRMYKN